MKAPFNLEAVYDADIAPLMEKIIKICKHHNMPMLACFNYSHGQNGDPDRDEFSTTYLHGDKRAPDELIEALQIVRNGASTRPKMVAITVLTKTADSG